MTILSRDRGLWRSSLLVGAVVAMVVASLAGVGIQKADAAEHPSIHVWLSGGAMIEFFNFTTGEGIDVSVVGVGSIGAVEAESERFVAEFDFEFDGNQMVVATQGAVTAEVVLVDMSIDFDGVNVFGTGPGLTTLSVEVVGSDCPFGDHSSKEVTTDASGEWATDFGVECPDGLGEEFQGSVFHFDDEGDATIVETAGLLADPGNQFQGRFVRQDAPPPISDGSLDTLTVGGGDSDGVVQARYQESGLSLCDNLVSPPRPLRGFASGFGTIENGTLLLDATLYCVVPGEGLVEQTKLPNLVLVFTFDEASDTVDFITGGVCLHRPNEGPCD